MTSRVAALAAVLLVVAPAASAAPLQSDELKALYAKARDMPGCSESWALDDVVAQCRKVVAAYRAAEAVSDSTPGARDLLVVERLKKQAILVAALRDQDEDNAAAGKELDAALADLDQLAPGDSNAFVRVETLDLQRQAALLALATGNPARADAAIAEFRRHSQGFFGALEQLRGNPKAMNQQRLNAIAAGSFEMELGGRYARMLDQGNATDKTALRTKAIEAFERVRQWATARAENRWNGFAEKAPAVLYADATLAMAKLAHEAQDMTALARYVSESQAVACGDSGGDDAFARTELGQRCAQTVLMEGWLTGANQALLRKISEQQEAQSRAIRDVLLK